MSQLIDIEAKAVIVCKKAQSKFDPMAPVDKAAKNGMEVVHKKVVEFGSSKLFKQSKYGAVRHGFGVGPDCQRPGALPAGCHQRIPQSRTSRASFQQGFLMGILNDVRGPKALFEQLLRLSKHNENPQEGDRRYGQAPGDPGR